MLIECNLVVAAFSSPCPPGRPRPTNTSTSTQALYGRTTHGQHRPPPRNYNNATYEPVYYDDDEPPQQFRYDTHETGGGGSNAYNGSRIMGRQGKCFSLVICALLIEIHYTEHPQSNSQYPRSTSQYADPSSQQQRAPPPPPQPPRGMGEDGANDNSNANVPRNVHGIRLRPTSDLRKYPLPVLSFTTEISLCTHAYIYAYMRYKCG